MPKANRRQRAADAGRYAAVANAIRYAILLVVLLLAPVPVFACDCDVLKSPVESAVRDRFASATAVLLAEVTDVRVNAESEQRATLRVLKAWKGSLVEGSGVRSVTFVGCCACGLAVKRGETLLLFLTGQEPYFLSICGFNGPLETRTDVIAVLDAIVQ